MTVNWYFLILEHICVESNSRDASFNKRNFNLMQWLCLTDEFEAFNFKVIH